MKQKIFGKCTDCGKVIDEATLATLTYENLSKVIWQKMLRDEPVEVYTACDQCRLNGISLEKQKQAIIDHLRSDKCKDSLNFDSLNLSGCSFDDCDLSNSKFINNSLGRSEFYDCDFFNASLNDCEIDKMTIVTTRMLKNGMFKATHGIVKNELVWINDDGKEAKL